MFCCSPNLLNQCKFISGDHDSHSMDNSGVDTSSRIWANSNCAYMRIVVSDMKRGFKTHNPTS